MCSTKKSRSSAAETWRPVAGFEGYYEVSDRGRVRGCERTIIADIKGRQIPRKIPQRPRPVQDRPNGYKFVALCKDGKKVMRSVHRLVAEAFIPNPEKLPEVNHRDEDKTNNNVENLEWCTSQYNNSYGTRIKRAADKRAVPIAAFSNDGTMVARFRSGADAERMTGISRFHISSCLNGKLATAGGYRWRYDENPN